eukprot:1160934-Pelagomonas_calceolata.AAC.1
MDGLPQLITNQPVKAGLKPFHQLIRKLVPKKRWHGPEGTADLSMDSLGQVSWGVLMHLHGCGQLPQRQARWCHGRDCLQGLHTQGKIVSAGVSRGVISKYASGMGIHAQDAASSIRVALMLAL